MTPPECSRRAFVGAAALTSASALTFPHLLCGQRARPAGDKLRLALVGLGARGSKIAQALRTERMVAFCDVDDAMAVPVYRQFPDVPRFRDYRLMFDKLGNTIDAVAIATPDHMHFPIAMAAMSFGKHVYLEKPMAHTVAEARKLARQAREMRVATQMGTQGHSSEGTLLLREWVEAGILGEVREIVSYCDRPTWPQGIEAPDHRTSRPAVPPTLDWDLWLGVAKPRDYDPAYLPFKWRGYWDFGTGALGDMGCHIMDGAYYALKLTQPTSVEAASTRHNAVTYPKSSAITYRFPARGNLPPVKWTWHDGGIEPPLPEGFEPGRTLLPDGGSFIMGSKATAMTSVAYHSVRIIPESKMQALAQSLPPKTLPRVPGGHLADWVRACKGGPAAGANFEYAAQLTETVLLGNVAIRARRRIAWDAVAMKVTDVPEANLHLIKEYRAGHGV